MSDLYFLNRLSGAVVGVGGSDFMGSRTKEAAKKVACYNFPRVNEQTRLRPVHLLRVFLLRIPPLRIKSLLETNPLKPELLVGGLGVLTFAHGSIKSMSSCIYSMRRATAIYVPGFRKLSHLAIYNVHRMQL